MTADSRLLAASLLPLALTLAACSPQDSVGDPAAADSELEPVTVTEYHWDGETYLDAPDAPDAAADADAAPAEPEPEPAPEVELAPGEVAFTGTVERWTMEQALRGNPVPNNDDPNDIYYVIIFDEPQEITARKAPDLHTEINDFGALGEKTKYNDDSAQWDPLVGKRVRITVQESYLGYQSDTSLPLGGVRIGEVSSVTEL